MDMSAGIGVGLLSTPGSGPPKGLFWHTNPLQTTGLSNHRYALPWCDGVHRAHNLYLNQVEWASRSHQNRRPLL